MDRGEALRLQYPAVQVPDDLGLGGSAREPNDRPSTEVKVNDGKPLLTQLSPELPSTPRVFHPAPPVYNSRLHASLLKGTDERSRPRQKPRVDAVSRGIDALGEGADNAGHARAFRLCSAKNMEYLVSHHYSRGRDTSVAPLPSQSSGCWCER